MNIDKLTNINQLRGEQRELAEIIGLDAYKKLIVNYAGSPIYIPKVESALKDIRDNEIRDKFDGKNYGQLARAYGLSEITVRDIVSEKRKQFKHAQIEGQITFSSEFL